MSLAEILKVATDKALAESGGGHNQKAINFQRIWAIARMFELEDSGQDFLLLFESIQDVAEFDSETNPTRISIYQVKKKDTAQWKWSELTNLNELSTKKSKSQSLTDIHKSTLGKLYASVMAFEEIKSTGCFISNMGCDLKLNDGGSAAASLTCDLSLLDTNYAARLAAALGTLHPPGSASPDLTRLTVKKVAIHPDAPESALVGQAHLFLKSRSPHHANQAEALVDTLLAKVSPLNAKTDKCASFAELRKERGYSRADFRQALAGLEQIPDIKSIVSEWLNTWPPDADFGPIQRTRTRVEMGTIFQNSLAGHVDSDDALLVSALDTWLADHPPTSDLAESLRLARQSLASQFPVNANRFNAHFLMRAASICAAQTSDS